MLPESDVISTSGIRLAVFSNTTYESANESSRPNCEDGYVPS